MQDYTDESSALMREKALLADNAGDSEKAAAFYALAQLIETNEAQADELQDAKKELENRENFDAYEQFFEDCFARLNAHFPCPSVTNEPDCAIIFDAIEKGESDDAQN